MAEEIVAGVITGGFKGVIQIFKYIKESGGVAIQYFPTLIKELDGKFQTIEMFEIKKEDFEEATTGISDTMGISKLHLSKEKSDKLKILQAKLYEYDMQKQATRNIYELKEEFDRIPGKKITFFREKKNKAKIERQLNIIKNYIEPLANKASEINDLLDEVGGEFSRKMVKHIPDMIKYTEEHDDCLIF